MPVMTDTATIAAAATALQPSAVAVVRISGPAAATIGARLFRPAGRTALRDAPRHCLYGTLTSSAGEVIDTILAVFFPGPRSFTGEDTVEFQCHGSPAIVRALLDAVCREGARLAEPGEFTRRAFLNGRLDLTQAEAIADLIAARSDAARAAALRQLRGGLSQEVHRHRETLIDIAALIEAYVDFPEEDLPPESAAAHLAELDRLAGALDRLRGTYEQGRHARDGFRVVLTGPPNAGKSSLFNALLRADRAIVSPHPGTTRDTIEASIQILGYEITLVDTAGLRETDAPLEQLGIARSRREAEQADLLLAVEDPTAERTEDVAVPRNGETTVPVLRVWTKADLAAPDSALPPGALHVSTLTGDGLADLEERLAAIVVTGSTAGEEAVITSLRHAQCLAEAARHVREARDALARSEPPDLAAIPLREAIQDLDDILGVRLGDDILDRIFARFCLGK